MSRVFACAVLLASAAPLLADRIAPPIPRPLLAAVTSDAVVVGTITEVESDPVKAKSHPDAKDETEYRVLVVKIEDALYGVKNATHVRVALTAAEFNSPVRTMKEDAKFLFYLTKHPTTNLYLPKSDYPSVSMTTRGADELLRRAKVATAAFNDPVKALKAKDKDDRVLAACALAMYYRKVPPNTKGTEKADRPADESKLLLETLAEGDWTLTGLPDAGNPYAVVSGLGLEDDGWKMVGTTGAKDVAAANHEAFKEWLAGKGKDARVKQIVAKK
jgi:hypothetical protein